MIKHNEYLLVEVPEGTGRFTIRSTEHCDHGSVSCYDRFTNNETLLFIPPGTYQLIGLAAELTEEQKKEICVPVKRPSEPVYYKLYNEPEDEQGDTPVATTDVNRAFISLLRSHNLKPETTVVIKEIKK